MRSAFAWDALKRSLICREVTTENLGEQYTPIPTEQLRPEPIPLDVKAGDRILFGKYAGQEVKLDGEEVLIMKEDDVLAVVGPATAKGKDLTAVKSKSKGPSPSPGKGQSRGKSQIKSQIKSKKRR